MDEKMKALLTFIGNNLFPSSPFLSPVIEFSIEVTGLLDKISEIYEIPKEEIGQIVNSSDADEEETE